MMLRPIRCAALAVILAFPLAAQQAPPADSGLLSVQRIYGGGEFGSAPFGPARWMAEGRAYTTLERPEADGRRGRWRDIVKYDAESGARQVIVPGSRLVAPGDTSPMTIENYAWAPDLSKVLIFTNARRVWRTNDRGDYWVLDLASGRLKKLGGAGAGPSTLMFAKFSPDGGRVGYVRGHNLYVEDLASGRIVQLTRDGARTRTNGSFDWVYEEELGLHDGWRWSPDGRWIAYWQLDITGVRDFPLINTTDSLYAYVNPVQYPKAGEPNSAGRVGVVGAAGGITRWMAVPGDPRNNYIARMAWTAAGAGAASGKLLIQHLNRLQDTLHVLLADPRTGAVRTLFTEEDPRAWVEQFDDLQLLNGGRDLLWESDRSGYRHLWLMSADGGAARPLTQGNWDVLGGVEVDAAGGWVYFVASPDNPTQRYLYRTRLDGTGAAERVSPESQAGTHGYTMAPGNHFAFHTYSSFGRPTVTELVSLPDHRVVRTLVDNAQLRQRVAALRLGSAEFFQVDGGGSTRLNGWMIKPPDFDPGRRYPVLFFVYGGPGSQTVLDSWGGTTWLWHEMLAQKGYIVASVDNRGTGARGRDFLKVIYGQLGVIETQDQIAAARAVGRWSFVDSTRLGIWGWSYGGFMSLNGITQGADVYRTAIAVAPVTHWRYYDNIYTERYNGLPQQNAAGYDRGSPLTYAGSLRGNLLIVHGTGDDNVHVQNTEAMINALVAANRPFQLMEYPNRTHSISGGNTTVHLRSLLTQYLQEHLPPGPAPGGRAVPASQ
jgi:dipeptidyl-peptidase-4